MPDKLFARESSSKEWEKQGDFFMKKKIYKTAKTCYDRGDVQVKSYAATAYLKVNAIPSSYQHKQIKSDVYVVAAELFGKAHMPLQAAKCLYNGEQYSLAANLFKKMEYVSHFIVITPS